MKGEHQPSTIQLCYSMVYSSTIAYKLNHVYTQIQNIFKVHSESTQVWNNFKKFQSPVQVNWAWKNFRKLSKFNSSNTWVKKFQNYFQSFECLVVKCQKILKNILSPNRKWIPNMAENCQSSDPKINGCKLKNSK